MQSNSQPSHDELQRSFRADGTITSVNQACCQFYQKSREELVGSNLAELLSVDERDTIINALFSINPDTPAVITRPKYQLADGTILYAEYRTEGFFRADGSVELYHSVGKIVARENENKPTTKTTPARNRDRSAILQEQGIGFFSKEMQEIINHAEMYHRDRSIPVLIEGETGVGKEIIAKLIHFGINNSLLPFVDINCTALSASLFESELFGYEAGAFTGAVRQGKQGKLDCAKGGTLFLDEVGEIPIELQAKLLRVLEEKKFYRVGGLQHIQTDIRVIAAANINFDHNVAVGSFRKDLYYRLKVGHIRIPALRERREEILPLAKMFLLQASKRRCKQFQGISAEACEALLKHPWPGNLRELKNLMEWVSFMYDSPLLLPEQIHCRLQVPTSRSEQPQTPQKRQLRIDRDEVERAISQAGGNKSKAARQLGISIRTLYNRLGQ